MKLRSDSLYHDLASSSGWTSRSIRDAWLTTRVKLSFALSNHVRGGEISVSTSNGLVALGGTAPSGVERDLAKALASNVEGVKQVNAAAIRTFNGD